MVTNPLTWLDYTTTGSLSLTSHSCFIWLPSFISSSGRQDRWGRSSAPPLHQWHSFLASIDRSDVHSTGQGLRSKPKSQRSKQILQYFGCFRTTTPIVISRWLRNCEQSLRWGRRCSFLLLAATKQLCEWYILAVSLSHLFFYLFPWYHHDICRSYYQLPKWGPCKRSRSKVQIRGENPT